MPTLINSVHKTLTILVAQVIVWVGLGEVVVLVVPTVEPFSMVVEVVEDGAIIVNMVEHTLEVTKLEVVAVELVQPTLLEMVDME